MTVYSIPFSPRSDRYRQTSFTVMAAAGNTVSGNTSSFSGTSAAIGAAEDSGLRFSYLLVTVEIAPRDWGIQRTTGNWAYTPAN